MPTVQQLAKRNTKRMLNESVEIKPSKGDYDGFHIEDADTDFLISKENLKKVLGFVDEYNKDQKMISGEVGKMDDKVYITVDEYGIEFYDEEEDIQVQVSVPEIEKLREVVK